MSFILSPGRLLYIDNVSIGFPLNLATKFSFIPHVFYNQYPCIGVVALKSYDNFHSHLAFVSSGISQCYVMEPRPSTSGARPKTPQEQMPRPSKHKKQLSMEEIEAELLYDTDSAAEEEDISDDEIVLGVPPYPGTENVDDIHPSLDPDMDIGEKSDSDGDDSNIQTAESEKDDDINDDIRRETETYPRRMRGRSVRRRLGRARGRSPGVGGRGRGRRQTTLQMETRLGWEDVDNFIPSIYEFDESLSGLQEDSNLTTEMDFLCNYIDDDVIGLMVEETNRYHNLMEPRTPATHHMVKWTDVTKEEMYVFLAHTLLMPHVEKNNVKHYWSTDELIETPIFGKYMSRDRYLQINQFLHFVDNEENQKDDRLWKIRNVFSFVWPDQYITFLYISKIKEQLKC